MNASSKKLSALSGAHNTISRRGPTWSISQPIIGPAIPMEPTTTEKPSDTCARLQPNRFSSGSTYAPNEPNETPSATIIAITMPVSTHQPE